MDAKPQRPRALRVNDENMLPPKVGNATIPGKTLHQRTKSTPAFSTLLQAGAVKAANKKVLGEVNANAKVAQVARDDSEIGKASPGKMAAPVEPVKPAATFARPAARPLAAKTVTGPNVSSGTASTTASVAPKVQSAEQAPKMATKKSTKVLREESSGSQPEADAKSLPSTSTAPGRQTVAVPKQAAVPVVQPQPSASAAVAVQEVRTTESVPLRDEPAVRTQVNAASVNVNSSSIPAPFTSEQEYMTFLQQSAANVHLHQPVAISHAQVPVQQASYVPAVQVSVQQVSYVPAVQAPVNPASNDDSYYDDGYTTGRSLGLSGESTGGVTTVLAPTENDFIQQELALAKTYVDATRTPEDIEDEQWDTSMVAEYGDEIFAFMRDLETRMAPNPLYMDQQQEIQWTMRAVLMDWVIQVHQRFNLLPETLFLTVNYIDRFLSCKIVSLGKLQLVGATALFVAAKYEEVQCPTIAEIIYMVDGGYTAEELLKAERFMLSMLQFELGWPGPMSFLRRISKADDYDLETRTLAKYFLEVTIMDERFVGCTPSFLAAGAHCMARLMLRKGDWSPAHAHYAGYTYSQLRKSLLPGILECCEEPQKHHAAVYEKYMDKRYKRASTFVEAEMERGFQLPFFSRGSSFGPLDSILGMW